MRRQHATIFILFATTLWATHATSRQNAPEMDEQTKAQVKKLRSISQAIKACPNKESPDTGNGKFTYGPPSNVTWDVKPSPSPIRAPFLGFIEFSLPRGFSASKKYCAQYAEVCARLLVQSSVPLRFEFDLGPDGLELMKLLVKNKEEDKEWSDIRPDAAVLSDTCWLKAAHAGEMKH
jgi:hypothetical protein